MADWRSRWVLIRTKVQGQFGRSPQTVKLRIKGPEQLEVEVRPGTTDMGLLSYRLYAGTNLPPEPIASQDLRQICEFGTNSGLALADLARRYRSANFLAVEPDQENIELARRNAAPFRDRCTLVESAVWDTDGELALDGTSPGKLLTRPAQEPEGKTGRVVKALSVETLLASHMPEGDIDFMHMDTGGGSEGRLLASRASWLKRVRSLRLHLYPEGVVGSHPLTVEDCRAILEGHGFDVSLDMRWWGGTMCAIRLGSDK